MEGQTNIAHESKACMKCGRFQGQKSSEKRAKIQNGQIKDTIILEESLEESLVRTNISVPEEKNR